MTTRLGLTATPTGPAYSFSAKTAKFFEGSGITWVDPDVLRLITMKPIERTICIEVRSTIEMRD